MKMRQILWSIRLVMLCCFFVVSYVPIILFTAFLFSNTAYFPLFLVSIILIILLGFLAVYGILKSKLELRLLVTTLFSVGLLFYIQNPYLLALGVILSWAFYKIWYIAFKYDQLDRDYSTYPSNSIEIQKLLKTFQGQFNSFVLLIWIVLSISWGIILIVSSFYIDLGPGEFGTLGISISIAIILLVRVVRSHFNIKITALQPND